MKPTIEIRAFDMLNPREEDVPYTQMICFHRRYHLGDDHTFKSEDYSGWSAMERDIIKKLKPAFIAPLYMYDHSAVDIATSYQPYWWHARWDAGQIGFIVVRKKEARELAKLYGRPLTEQDFQDIVEGELKEYVKYLNGWQEYDYVIKDANTDEILDYGGSGYDSEEDARRDGEAHIKILEQEEVNA